MSASAQSLLNPMPSGVQTIDPIYQQWGNSLTPAQQAMLQQLLSMPSAPVNPNNPYGGEGRGQGTVGNQTPQEMQLWQTFAGSLTPDQKELMSGIDPNAGALGNIKGFVTNALQSGVDLTKGIISHPQQTIFGGTPLGTKIENAVTGSNLSPLIGQLGGPTAQQWQQVQSETGYKTGGNVLAGQVADIIAGGYASMGLAGALGATPIDPATDVAPVTDASLAYDPSTLLASNTATGIADTGTAGGLPAETFNVGLPDLSGMATPAQLPGPSVLSQISSYTPKNLISNQLQEAGLNPVVSNAVGGAVQGAGTSVLRGGNPVTGAISGGVGGAWGGTDGIGAGVSDSVGGGVLGSTVSGAAGGALGSVLSGKDPLTGAITGGVTGGVTDATGSSLVGNLAGKATGIGLASSGTTTAGGKMADPLQPMSGVPGSAAPATIPSASPPTSTATMGLPGTGIPNGPAAITPAGLINGTGLGGASPATQTPSLPDPGASTTAGAVPTDPGSSLLSDIGTGISTIGSTLLGGNSVTSMAPYLAIGALGFAQADQAKKDAQAQSDKVAALGTPYTQAGTQMLDQYKSGTLTPAQQKVVDTAVQQGNTILASDPQLQAIYTQAFGDYQSGTLRPADQLALDQKVAAQKAQVRQSLSSMGITDSTILAAQDQQIDNQAIMTKQQLLDAQFATGNQAFSTWLKTTEDGMNMIQQGQMFAVTSLQQTFNNALNAGQTGMNPVIQSVQMEIAADAQLGTAVSDLLGNLAKAYAYTSYQQTQPGGAAGGNNPLSKVGGSTGQTGSGASAGLTNLMNTGSPTGGTAIPNLVGSLGSPSQYPDYGQQQTTAPTASEVSGSLPAVTPGSVTSGMNLPDLSQPQTTDPSAADVTANLPSVDLSGDTISQDTLNAIYGGSFDPATSDTTDLVSYFAGTW